MSNYEQENMFFRYPSREEIKAAQLACCGKCCTACETPAEYAWRKRGVDMAVLLERAIENELSPTERDTIRDRWFESMSVAEIASVRGISISTVSVTLKRAQEKLKKVLGYAVKYQHDICDETAVSLILGRARAIAAARNFSGTALSERIRALRIRDNVSDEMLRRVTAIPTDRIRLIESGKKLPDANELIALSEAFGVTVDYILKGGKQDG